MWGLSVSTCCERIDRAPGSTMRRTEAYDCSGEHASTFSCNRSRLALQADGTLNLTSHDLHSSKPPH